MLYVGVGIKSPPSLAENIFFIFSFNVRKCQTLSLNKQKNFHRKENDIKKSEVSFTVMMRAV